jgi:hypothetical protein
LIRASLRHPFAEVNWVNNPTNAVVAYPQVDSNLGDKCPHGT